MRWPPKFRQVVESRFCFYNEIDQGRMCRKRSETGNLVGLPYLGERQSPACSLHKMACSLIEMYVV